MEFYETVKTRRSIRSYKGKEIPEEKLLRVMDAARVAPSGHNRQYWKFYIVESEDKKRKVAEACSGQTWIAEAPAVIVATGWKVPFSRGGYMGDMTFTMDVSIAFTHLILAARAEGLGTCWIGDFSNEKVKEALGLPEKEYVVAVTPIGYPDKGGFTENTSRKKLDEVMERL
ncbi:nitroreductase [Candidatus Bathyarchaeota archaeon]|nr:nitroreductase [Candidatus Bathyarchaeota archaeon]